MKILLYDKMQIAAGAPAAIKSPALSDIYTEATSIPIAFSTAEAVNCIGIGYTNATLVSVRDDKPFDAAVMNLPLESNANDISGNDNATTANNITWTGGVANFNGTNSRIIAPESLKLNPDTWSVSFWFNTTLDTEQSLVATHPDGVPAGMIIRTRPNNCLALFLSSDGTTYDIVNGSQFLCGCSLNGNVHVIVQFTGTQYQVFVNRVLRFTVTSSVAIRSDYRFISLGQGLGSATWLTGVLDDFYIFNRHLTIAEIDYLYTKKTTQTINITQIAPYHNGLYLFDCKAYTNKYTISHNGTYIGRIGIGVYRTLGTSVTKEMGFYTTNESRVTEGGQVIPGAGGYCGRRLEADVRYKVDEDVYSDLLAAYATQISKDFPFFILNDDEQHKLPVSMLHFYARTKDSDLLLQSSTYKFLYSYKFKFYEAF